MKTRKSFQLPVIGSLFIFSFQTLAWASAPMVTPASNPAVKPVDVAKEVTTLSKVAPKIDKQALNLALNAYNKAVQQGITQKPVLTVIDYSLPDIEKRMWIFDLAHNQLLLNTLVAHGRNSGDVYAKKFSNAPQSKMTSLGVYLTSNTYYGHEGYSLRLQGLSKGFNNNAYLRDIVVHGAWYVSENFVEQYHRLGRSWGCPSVSKTVANQVINTIKDGTLLFAFAKNQNWLSHDTYVS